MTPQEFAGAGGHLSVPAGKLYAYKVKAFGEVAELLPVDPGCVVPKLNGSWEPILSGHIPGWLHGCTEPGGYLACAYADAGRTGGAESIAYAREAISLAAATEEHRARLFSNGAVTSGVFAYRADAVRSGL